MRDITVDRPVDQSHFECNVCPWKSHLKRKMLHFNLTQYTEITHSVSPRFKHKSTGGLSKTIADEVGEFGITVNTIGTGTIDGGDEESTFRINYRKRAAERGIIFEEMKAIRVEPIPMKRGQTGGGSRASRLLVIRYGRLHHRTDDPDRWRKGTFIPLAESVTRYWVETAICAAVINNGSYASCWQLSLIVAISILPEQFNLLAAKPRETYRRLVDKSRQ